MRSFEEELQVLNRRVKWRCFDNFGEPGEVMYLPLIRQRIYTSEKVLRCLLANDDHIVVTYAEK